MLLSLIRTCKKRRLGHPFFLYIKGSSFLRKKVFNNKNAIKKTGNKANFNASHEVTEKTLTKRLTFNESVNLRLLRVLVLSS